MSPRQKQLFIGSRFRRREGCRLLVVVVAAAAAAAGCMAADLQSRVFCFFPSSSRFSPVCSHLNARALRRQKLPRPRNKPTAAMAATARCAAQLALALLHLKCASLASARSRSAFCRATRFVARARASSGIVPPLPNGDLGLFVSASRQASIWCQDAYSHFRARVSSSPWGDKTPPSRLASLLFCAALRRPRRRVG